MPRTSDAIEPERTGVTAVPTGTCVVHLICESDPVSIRTALTRVLGRFARLGIDQENAQSAQILLAEVLNNISEHAYGAPRRGTIELEIRKRGAELFCRIEDEGTAMPNGMLPAGSHAPLQTPTEHLPEGGFGWSLIHQLASQIAYRRESGRNRLSFKLRGKR